MNSGATHHDDRAPKARHPSTGPGMTVPRLTFAEQLVLWSARRLSAAGLGAAATETEASACRQDVLARVGGELGVALRPTGGPTAGSEAVEALERTLDIFGCAGVRSLRLNPTCCRFVSNDERLFMSFLAGCQEGDCRHTATLLSWFLPPAAVRTAATDGASFAAALLGAGFRLPQRLHLAASAGTSPGGASGARRTADAALTRDSHHGHGLRSARRRRACESPRFQTTIISNLTDCERGL